MSLKTVDRYQQEAEKVHLELMKIGLFSKTYSSRGEIEKLVFDEAKAYDFATSQVLPKSYEYWIGLREKHFSERLPSKEKMSDDKNQKKKYLEISQNLERSLFLEIKKNVLKRNLNIEIAGVIFEDFRMIVQKRAFRKEPHPWAEGMHRIYMAGGWPCGWEGRYPDGNLLIFTVR